MLQPAIAPLQASAKPTFLLDTVCARLCRWLRCAVHRADLVYDGSDGLDLKYPSLPTGMTLVAPLPWQFYERCAAAVSNAGILLHQLSLVCRHCCSAKPPCQQP